MLYSKKSFIFSFAFISLFCARDLCARPLADNSGKRTKKGLTRLAIVNEVRNQELFVTYCPGSWERSENLFKWMTVFPSRAIAYGKDSIKNTSGGIITLRVIDLDQKTNVLVGHYKLFVGPYEGPGSSLVHKIEIHVREDEDEHFFFVEPMASAGLSTDDIPMRAAFVIDDMTGKTPQEKEQFAALRTQAVQSRYKLLKSGFVLQPMSVQEVAWYKQYAVGVLRGNSDPRVLAKMFGDEVLKFPMQDEWRFARNRLFY